MFFCLICCGFKAKREEIGNNSFGCDEKKKNGFFPAQMFLKPRDQKQKKEFFQRFFPRKQQLF